MKYMDSWTICQNMIVHDAMSAYRYGKDYPVLEGKDLSKKQVLAIGCPEFWRLFGSTQ